ncbi:serine/threonine protein kinase [Kineosporia succinea]|uniref:non-specific serine/threonine protein kinase n=1 Tax=Kineosporia succinea TaxID=84632 RepID=A0ABT9P0I0_9ACTN|nr:serine/threonine-protein kinase [Kineosporia succinea]MDP9826081.1 serine/threonine-protein kinase [Kineosporia succinea]
MPGPETPGFPERSPEGAGSGDAVTIEDAPEPVGSSGPVGGGTGDAGTTGPIDVSGLPATDERARMAGAARPNGWFSGPPDEPDRYELLGPGLSGGEGDIWRARYRGDLTSPLPVAVKRLRRPATAGDDWPTPADRRRWEDLRALLLIMRIDHLVSVLDVFVGPPPHLPGQAGSGPVTPYVVMEWVPGPTLADEFGGLPAAASTLDGRLDLVEQAASALDALHSRTVSAGNPSLHRDVKPANCILAPERGVVLVDVGTMRRVDDGRDLSGRHTPAYTAPEVLADPMAARDPASDLYSLGALAWFCLVGENPPHARDPLAPEHARRRAQEVARAAGVPDPAAFASHLTRLLAHDPASRPTDARVWARELRALGPVRRPVPLPLVAAAAVIPLVAIALILLPLWLTPDRSGTGDRADGATTRAATTSSAIDRAGPPEPAGSAPATRGGQPGPPVPGPGGHAPPPPSGPWPEGNVTTDVAAFETPGNGASIGRCPPVSGTARLPPGHTLVFSVENLSVGDQVRHVTPIRGWQRPESLRRWRLRPPVGLPEDRVGERYRLELIVVPLDELRARDPHRIPDDSYVGASLFVERGSRSRVGC